jgi:hypothetical protein
MGVTDLEDFDEKSSSMSGKMLIGKLRGIIRLIIM